ncbi:MAG: N,N-dimethylformamidase [Deltaproteobacteria bacterium]|jgi:N,N-dimethylformamidase|nr:N,N-dimethylformamidase [Deltaproteobacteria bacterium]
MTDNAPLLGYCDRLTLRPGEQVGFRVGSRTADIPYRAEIVRLRCADIQREGPGFSEEVIPSQIDGDYLARPQRIDRGSRAIVPADAALADLRSFSLQVAIWPTRPGEGRQSLISSWDAGALAGFTLLLDESGCPALIVSDGQGTHVELTTARPLRPRQWVLLSAVYDAESGRARIVQEPRASTAGEALLASAQIDEISVARITSPLPQRPLVFAARSAGEDARGTLYSSHFDGKLEAPRLARTALSNEDLRRLASPSPPRSLNEVVVGCWDFALDMDGRRVSDRSKNGLDGQLENLPTRAVTGIHWDGSEYDWRHAPEQYAAIHFHSDDLYDAGWEEAFELTIPDDWKSGFYAARLRSEGATDHVPFFVCPPRGRADSKLAFLVPTATYLAYANLPDPHTYAAFVDGEPVEVPAELMRAADDFGGSCYQSHDDTSGIHHSSHLRPVLTLKPRQDLWGFNADSLIVDWLEESGFDYDVITDHLLHEEGSELLEPYQAVVTGTHPEYYSTCMLDALDSFLGAGGRLAYLGGNGFYWRIGFSKAWPAAIEVRRAEDGTRTWESQPGEYHQAWGGEL